MYRKSFLVTLLCFVAVSAMAGTSHARRDKKDAKAAKAAKDRKAAKTEPQDKTPSTPDAPPLRAWSAVWHSAATVQYSSCPGTEPGHQEAFTLSVLADETKIVATEQPEQSLARKFFGTADLRGKRWVLELRDKDGKNGMDVYLSEDGKSLVGTRVVVRKAKKALCSVVYSIEASRDEV